jgi:hypothetical protein
VSTVSYDVEADEVNGRKSTSIGVDGESPKGEGGRERIGIVFGNSLARGVLLCGEDGNAWGQH